VREEFQPVLAYLSRMRQEAFDSLVAIDLTKPAEEVKTQTAVYIMQLKCYSNIQLLPELLKQLEYTDAQRAAKVVQMKSSQEGGEL
jgi:hypothetical protein